MKGYKAFNKGWKSMHNFQYEIGKTYELPKEQKLEICKCGFHFCKNPIDVFGYYPMNDDTLIAEIEALGEIRQEGIKFCTDKIRIVKEITRKQWQELNLNGKYNSGYCNSGEYNTGDYNSGNHNCGDRNSGYCNSGDHNSGAGNTGHYNSGDYNSGNRNAGHYNSGNHNSGACNCGCYNSGDYNTGHYNSGNYNTGHYNSGDCNSGIFNSNEPKLRAFNRDSNMTYDEFLDSIDYCFIDLCMRINNKKLIKGDIERIKALPNFDAGIFEECTGINIFEEEKENER